MLKHTFLVVTLAAFCAMANAQNYPAKPIRLLIPYAPGGGTDLVVRPVTQKLGEALKTQILLDNRGSAFGIIAVEAAARSAPDGYTLLVGGTSTLTLNPVLYLNVPFDPVKDFSPITILALAPNVLAASRRFSPNTTQEVIAYAKANPGKVNYGSAGTATARLYLEQIKQLTGADMLLVPYKGTGPAFTALLAGEVDLTFAAAGVVTAAIKDGRVKAIGVGSQQRIPALPDVPSMTESGLLPGFESASWYGIVAPSGTPKPVISMLHGEIVKILKAPEVENRYAADGAFPVGNSPESFAERIRTELDRWARIAKTAGIKPATF